MPIRILEKEKEGHRKVKTDFRKKPLRASKAIGGGLRKGFKHALEQLGGDEKAKPHSTEKGRIASGKRRFKRILDKVSPGPDRPDFRPGDWRKPRPRPLPRPIRPRPGRPLPEDWKRLTKDKRRNWAREKKGIGGILKGAKNIISKVLKPKGVFKPKPVPKAVTDVDKPFKGYDKSFTRADDNKINSMLKKLGDEIKAQPLPSKLKKTMKKLQKAYPHKKAKGGRIGLQHGNRPRPQGPHTWVRKKPKGVKIAIKGW